MKKINCVIADDEELAREVIENYIAKVDELCLVASCTNGADVYNILRTEHIDLLFLDIEMPELTGMELLRTLKNPPAVIMTTAYRDFALESFELDVLDYLLKPVSFERFLKATGKYMNLRGNASGFGANDDVVAKDDADAFIYIRSESKMVRILINDILYIETMKDYVNVHTKHKSIITYHPLNYFEEKLSADRFLRIHRSFMIALRHISAYTTTEIEINSQRIPIGVTYAKKVIQRLQQ